MATIKDVAREAQVSIATVSRVINQSPKASPAAIEAVQTAMKKLGYRPNANARALVSQSSNTVGVLVGDVSDPFFGAMVKAVDEQALRQNKHVLIGNGYHDAQTEQQALELLLNNRCDALLVHSKGLSDEALSKLADELPNLVLINRYIENIAPRCIALDNFHGAYLATQHLIEQGHRHIGYLGSNQHIEDSSQRYHGYRQALIDHHIELHQDYVAYGEPNLLGGEQAMQNLLPQAASLTAIACYNDYMAAGAMSVLAGQHIRVPQQVSLIGFDNSMVSQYLNPKLTTIDYPITEMAQQALKLSLQLAQGIDVNHADQANMIKPTLVLRNSVTALKA